MTIFSYFHPSPPQEENVHFPQFWLSAKGWIAKRYFYRTWYVARTCPKGAKCYFWASRRFPALPYDLGKKRVLCPTSGISHPPWLHDKITDYKDIWWHKSQLWLHDKITDYKDIWWHKSQLDQGLQRCIQRCVWNQNRGVNCLIRHLISNQVSKK